MPQMTVGQLKQWLAQHEVSDDARIEVPIRTYTQRYTVAYIPVTMNPQYLSPRTPDEAKSDPGTVRICISLPEGASVSKRRGTPAEDM